MTLIKKGWLPMNRLSVRLTTLIDFISLLTLGAEFLLAYYCSNTLINFLIICLVLLVCTSIFIRVSKSFDSAFLYSFSLVLFSSCIVGFIYMKGNDFSIPYRDSLLVLILLNWLVPMLCSLLHNLHDTREQYSHFISFFKKSSTQFIIYYIGFLALIIIIRPDTLTCSSEAMQLALRNTSHGNLIPFYSMACYIEDSIYNNTTLYPLIQYLITCTLITLPYGFYISLAYKNKGHLVRLFLLFLLPTVIEVCKQFIMKETGDVEHVLLGVLGGLIGSCLFFLLNSRYNKLRRHDFLEGREYN